MTRWLSDEEQNLWRAWIAVNAALEENIEVDLHRRGLTQSDYEILAHLSEAPNDTLRMTELADAILLTKSGLTYRVSQLEARGLVLRRTCPQDGRGVWATLTKSGRRLIETAAPDHVETVRDSLIDHLRPATRKALLADLKVLLAGQGKQMHGPAHSSVGSPA